ncbi:MAG: DUF1330 domain-containing protein [Lachnospiraceae bacterium]|nr:DUF1330 domain-containing protein [Lachnospiraceae bacterium]
MCYFLVDTYIPAGRNHFEKGRGLYDHYIEKVKPIVERYGGIYLLRSEQIESLSQKRSPQRVIIIHFPNYEHLQRCFASKEYQEIMAMRTENVDARALIVRKEQENEGSSNQN